MQKNSQDFSMQEALRLAKSPAGQQLLAMLKQSDQAQLQSVMEYASQGDFTQAGNALHTMLSTPEAKQLLDELGR